MLTPKGAQHKLHYTSPVRRYSTENDSKQAMVPNKFLSQRLTKEATGIALHNARMPKVTKPLAEGMAGVLD